MGREGLTLSRIFIFRICRAPQPTCGCITLFAIGFGGKTRLADRPSANCVFTVFVRANRPAVSLGVKSVLRAVKNRSRLWPTRVPAKHVSNEGVPSRSAYSSCFIRGRDCHGIRSQSFSPSTVRPHNYIGFPKMWFFFSFIPLPENTFSESDKKFYAVSLSSLEFFALEWSFSPFSNKVFEKVVKTAVIKKKKTVEWCWKPAHPVLIKVHPLWDKNRTLTIFEYDNVCRLSDLKDISYTRKRDATLRFPSRFYPWKLSIKTVL